MADLFLGRPRSRRYPKFNIRRDIPETRITTWYLAGIEEEHFDRFPGKFYFKSFAGQYARELGLNESEVVRDLQSAYDAWEEKHKPAPPADGFPYPTVVSWACCSFRSRAQPRKSSSFPTLHTHR